VASKHSTNGQIGAEVSWSRTRDRSVTRRAAREAFLKRIEDEVDPDASSLPTNAVSWPTMPYAVTRDG
jgi:hypothetical protein